MLNYYHVTICTYCGPIMGDTQVLLTTIHTFQANDDWDDYTAIYRHPVPVVWNNDLSFQCASFRKWYYIAGGNSLLVLNQLCVSFNIFYASRTTHYSGEKSLLWSSIIAHLVWQCTFFSDTTPIVNPEVSFLTYWHWSVNIYYTL